MVSTFCLIFPKVAIQFIWVRSCPAKIWFSSKIAAVNRTFKLMATPNPQLYNMHNDPHELNLYGTEPVIQRQLTDHKNIVFRQATLHRLDTST